MKIVITCRTRDEEKNIEKFLRCHQWADKILILDGGSEDKTVEIASNYPKTEVRHYGERVYRGNSWINPCMQMVNVLLEWADEEEKADWIIYDDCDCVPNVELQKIARSTMENCKSNFVLTNRIYIYKKDWYFDWLSGALNNWGVGTWAWRGGIGMRANNYTSIHHTFTIDDFTDACEIHHPACRLHYFCQSDEDIEKKLQMGRIFDSPKIMNPVDFAGQLIPIAPYMIDEEK
jgi:glycosyltransferase involved in cell wall biosynthesis